MSLDSYSYDLPEELIAQEPAIPRDASKLLVYDTKADAVSVDSFFHLDRYLPKKSFLVLNKTKVVPSRVVLKKETGGKVKAFFLLSERNEVLFDRKVRVGERLFFNKRHCITVTKQKEKIFEVQYDFDKARLLSLLNATGAMPIPPYIKHSPLTRQGLRKKYQTIFAEKLGSVAAPTASLHFTRRLFQKLEEQEIQKCFVTLHVGLGTFAPVTEHNVKERKLHEEYFEIEKETLKLINKLKHEGKSLVAVGTTVVRTLESFDLATQFLSHESLTSAFGGVPSKAKKLLLLRHNLFAKTDLFIFPPYDFKMVDCLITNFHLPRSSLMMLVDAFLKFKKAKRNILDLYSYAIEKRLRFYSFGDAMMIL